MLSVLSSCLGCSLVSQKSSRNETESPRVCARQCLVCIGGSSLSTPVFVCVHAPVWFSVTYPSGLSLCVISPLKVYSVPPILYYSSPPLFSCGFPNLREKDFYEDPVPFYLCKFPQCLLNAFEDPFPSPKPRLCSPISNLKSLSSIPQ